MADLLRAHGYWCMRSAGSGGLVDVLAKCPGDLDLMIQAKCDAKKITVEEWNLLLMLANDNRCHAIVAQQGKDGPELYRITGYRKPRQPWPWEPFTLTL